MSPIRGGLWTNSANAPTRTHTRQQIMQKLQLLHLVVLDQA